MVTRKVKAEPSKSAYNFSFAIKSNTTTAPSGARLEKKMSIVHMNDILRRRVKKREG